MTVGIVSPGAMGSAVGAAYRAAGRRVVTTVAGRSQRTRALAEQAGLELVPTSTRSSRRPSSCSRSRRPTRRGRSPRDLVGAAERTGARPLVSDWNAVSPATVRGLADILADARARARRRLDLGRAAARRLPHARLRLGHRAADAGWLEPRLARRTRRRHGPRVGVGREDVHRVGLQGLHRSPCPRPRDRARERRPGRGARRSPRLFPRQIDGAARLLAVSTTKSGRYVGEMREIAATQASTGLTPALFEAMAEVYAQLAATELAARAPESIPSEPELEDVLERLLDAGERT